MERSSPSQMARPGGKVLTALMTSTAMALAWGMVCIAPGIPWNGARLAPSFALARGLPIYAPRESGAQLGWIYGPVFPLWHLPAALTDNPTVGLVLAALWNALTIVAPLGLVVRTAARGSPEVARFATAWGTILLLANPVTRAGFLFLHVDAVCLLWAVVACIALHAAAGRDWRPGLPLAAVAIALSIAAKQVAVMLIPATLAWLWSEGHRHLLGRWVFWLVVCCGGLAAVFFAACGAEGVLFNTWLVLSRMPWQGGWSILGRNILGVITSAWLWVVAAGTLSWAAGFRWRDHTSPEARSLVRLLLWLALWQLPVGLMASMMVDAGLNSIHAANYLMIAGLIMVSSALSRRDGATRRLWPVLAVVTGIGIVASCVPSRKEGLAWTPYRGQEELVTLARRHQGKIYLPWNPLTTIITERKIYPFDEALHFMWMAGLEPSREAILAAVPPKPMIIYQEPSQGHFALRYFAQEAQPEGGRPAP